MNKSDLIQVVAQKANISEKKAETIVSTLFDSMSETLVTGGRIEIRGFGSFTVKEYAGYEGRNPKTGLPVDVKPKKLPFFKVGKELKAIVGS